jgi:hypothetical protein
MNRARPVQTAYHKVFGLRLYFRPALEVTIEHLLLPMQSKVKSMRVQRVNSVAKQCDQPRETGEGRECSLVGLCGLQMFSTCVANSIKGKIHQVQRRSPLQISITSPTRQGG